MAQKRSRSRIEASDSSKLTINGHEISVTRLSKVLYPGSGFTKAEVIDYYVRVAPYILPHLKDRPVTLKRYPDGIQGEGYWDKDAPGFTPSWIETFPVPRHAGGPDIHYILINNTATLAWTANVAALELHPFLHTKPDIASPASLVFDLDPGAGTDIFDCIEVALLLRSVLEQLRLESFPKVSGSKGIQLYVPLNTSTSYDATQPFAHTVAQMMEQRYPKLAVAVMPKEKRAGKVFIDWSQNSDYKTTVGVYSMRAKNPRPFISMPLTWHEMEAARKRKKAEALYFEPQAALRRLSKVGDLFAPVLELRQKLPSGFSQALEEQNSLKPPRSAR